MAQLPKHRVELIGKGVTGACIALVALLVVTLVAMVAQRGIATFAVDGIDLGAFLTGTTWNPHQDDVNGMPTVGALPMISGSFAVTLLSTLFALPIAIGSAIFVVEIAPRFGRRVFQPLIELLVGIPSVVYGLIGLTVVVAWTRDMAAAAGQTITGFGIFSSAIVLAVMILPTITSLSIDALAAVPNQYREGSYALGCNRWQTVWNVVLRSAAPSLMTAVILGMTRAFGEALAVQMVVGNAIQMPTSLFAPASTLTSVLTMGMGNEAMGTVYNDVLWSLALLLLLMSLVFILVIHLIGHKGGTKRG
ncbi:phosphate ABC transporter permease subunit PstC [Ellagibacter isourolithinifaciens]|uniref:phosphate ABC transporter permease subunit PstC n=1 Tax=Ellagibacter isourolithinifaciens TaxID=2137581 RepID=UPI003A92B432